MRREVTTKTVRLLDREQAASHLGMTKGALTMRVYRKQVPFLRVGRRMFFDVEAIDAWIQKQTETAGHRRRGSLERSYDTQVELESRKGSLSGMAK